MKLNLKNPLVFFDLETTGTNINTDRIVEICYLKVFPNGNEVSKSMRINPEMHIPEASTAIHGIHDEDVVTPRSRRMDLIWHSGKSRDLVIALASEQSMVTLYSIFPTFSGIFKVNSP